MPQPILDTFSVSYYIVCCPSFTLTLLLVKSERKELGVNTTRMSSRLPDVPSMFSSMISTNYERATPSSCYKIDCYKIDCLYTFSIFQISVVALEHRFVGHVVDRLSSLPATSGGERRIPCMPIATTKNCSTALPPKSVTAHRDLHSDWSVNDAASHLHVWHRHLVFDGSVHRG
jgi:hypothetical protein